MNRTITAVYENGVLRLLDAVPLSEHQTVHIQIMEQDTVELDLALRELAIAGVITPPRGYSSEDELSGEERNRVAEALGRAPGRSASEIIVEERGDP